MSTSPNILPAAANLAKAILTILISHKRILASDLDQRASWAYGASRLASAMGDEAAADLLSNIDITLSDLATRRLGEQEVLAELGNLLERISGNGQEVSQ